MDVLSKAQRSYCMSRIRGKNTKPEVAVRKQLFCLGLRYRLHYKLHGRPDIVFVKQRVAIFIDGCFWHGCPVHSGTPKTNTVFWQKKITSNIERDQRNRRLLKKEKWKVLCFWEHEVKNDVLKVTERILKTLTDRSADGGNSKKIFKGN